LLTKLKDVNKFYFTITALDVFCELVDKVADVLSVVTDPEETL
jgi:hypothetical protein